MRSALKSAIAVWLGGVTLALGQTAPSSGTTAGTMVGSTAASAPAAPGTQTPAAQSPYWNGNAGQSASIDLPAADIRAVPPAHANAVRAFWSFDQSLFDLNNAVRLARTLQERRPEYVKAVTDAQAAYADAEAARVKALAALNDNPAYVGAETLRRNVTAQIADEQFSNKPDAARLAAMAKLKLQYVQDNRKLEASALERDAAYQDARRRSLDAARRVADLDKDQALQVATDDTLVSLRRQVADARIDKLASQAYYDSTVIARNRAVRYALRYHYYDTYHGYGGYGYGGFGGYGGYGSGGYGLGPGGYGIGGTGLSTLPGGTVVGSPVR